MIKMKEVQNKLHAFNQEGHLNINFKKMFSSGNLLIKVFIPYYY